MIDSKGKTSPQSIRKTGATKVKFAINFWKAGAKKMLTTAPTPTAMKISNMIEDRGSYAATTPDRSHYHCNDSIMKSERFKLLRNRNHHNYSW